MWALAYASSLCLYEFICEFQSYSSSSYYSSSSKKNYILLRFFSIIYSVLLFTKVDRLYVSVTYWTRIGGFTKAKWLCGSVIPTEEKIAWSDAKMMLPPYDA